MRATTDKDTADTMIMPLEALSSSNSHHDKVRKAEQSTNCFHERNSAVSASLKRKNSDLSPDYRMLKASKISPVTQLSLQVLKVVEINGQKCMCVKFSKPADSQASIIRWIKLSLSHPLSTKVEENNIKDIDDEKEKEIEEDEEQCPNEEIRHLRHELSETTVEREKFRMEMLDLQQRIDYLEEETARLKMCPLPFL